MFFQRAISTLCNAALLQHAFHRVFALDAVFSKERIPQVANVLSALVVVQALDECAKLELDVVGHVCHGQLQASCGASRACVISASI
jgi:hypothetical protein